MAKKGAKTSNRGNGDEIDWEKVEQEFRHLHKDVLEPDRKRMLELQELALKHDRELVIYGTSAWLVEYMWEEPEVSETRI